MVKIDNKIPDNDNDSDSQTNKHSNEPEETQRYKIDTRELTFPIDGMKHGKVVNENQTESSPNKQVAQQQQQITAKPKEEEKEKDYRIVEYEKLQKLKYDENVKFIHLPDDPAYQPISIELIKMNDLENDDLRLNTRIMMNIALSDYVIFRQIGDDDSTIPIKVYFRRVKTNEFQDYVDIQTQLDDLVKRVGIIDSKYPFTLEDQDQLYEVQKRLIKTARERVKKGFDIFFKLSKEEKELYADLDNNDIAFNVDSAFLRITKSPFLRRKSSPSS